MNDKHICTLGIWDESVPGITFDNDGVSNFARLQQKFEARYPRNDKGMKQWEDLCKKIRSDGAKKEFDCIIGVSGGTDSSYLLHLAVEKGLRPLAVNLDNGWSSEISVNNIKRITSALSIPLETYVINYEEVKDVFLSFMKASLPWVDTPTDLAIKAVLYKTAQREKVKHILIGQDFRTEGKQPMMWTYCDNKQFNYIHRKFGNLKLKSFPKMTQTGKIINTYIKGIKIHRPFYHLDYNKNLAAEFLQNKYRWEYYGGHHHENIFTRFAIAYWLPRKFNIDKRIITLSAQVLSGSISREYALEQIKQPPFPIEEMERDVTYVTKKLGIDNAELQRLMELPNKFYYDYPSSLPFIKCFLKYFGWLIKIFIPNKSLTMIALEDDGII